MQRHSWTWLFYRSESWIFPLIRGIVSTFARREMSLSRYCPSTTNWKPAFRSAIIWMTWCKKIDRAQRWPMCRDRTHKSWYNSPRKFGLESMLQPYWIHLIINSDVPAPCNKNIFWKSQISCLQWSLLQVLEYYTLLQSRPSRNYSIPYRTIFSNWRLGSLALT